MLYVTIILYYLHHSLGYKMTVKGDFQIDSSFIQDVIKVFNIPNHGHHEYDRQYPSIKQLLEDELKNGRDPNDNDDELPDGYDSKYARLIPGAQQIPYPEKHMNVPAFTMDDLLGAHTDKYALVWVSKHFGDLVKRYDRVHYLKYASPYPDDLMAQRIKDIAVLRNVYIVSYGGKPSLTYWSNHSGEYQLYRPRCYPGNRIDRPDHILIREKDLIGYIGDKKKFLASLKSFFPETVDALDYDDYYRFRMPYPEVLIDRLLNDTAAAYDVQIKSYGGRSMSIYWNNYPFEGRTVETKISKEDIHGSDNDIKDFLAHTKYFKYEIENLDAVYYKKYGTKFPKNRVARHLDRLAQKYNVQITANKLLSIVDQTK